VALKGSRKKSQIFRNLDLQNVEEQVTDQMKYLILLRNPKFLTGQRGSRLIVNYQQSEPAQTTPPPAATPNQGAQSARLETTLTK
jgi:hypothetical protein